MKIKHKLSLILIILSVFLYSCFPLRSNRYGDQGDRGREERRHSEQHEDRDHGDRNNDSSHDERR